MALDHVMLSDCQACDHTAVARAVSPSDRWPSDLEPYVPVPALGDDAIRLAFNESPLGPFPAALAAIQANTDAVSQYPELDGRLIARLAERHGLTSAMIALGNGADAIIGYISSAFLRPGDEVITGWPSFPTYVTDACKQAAAVTLVPLSDGGFDLDAIADRIGPRTKLIWVCSPNNPTGGVVTREDFGRFIDAVEAHAVERGWTVRHDDPYAGGFTTQHYGRPSERVHAVQVELARRLYLDETTLRPAAGFDSARLWCRDLVAKLGRVSELLKVKQHA